MLNYGGWFQGVGNLLPFFEINHIHNLIFFSRFMYLLPAVAYHLGFSTVYQKNPEREIIFRVIEKAPGTHVAIVKVPGVGDHFPFSRITNSVPFLNLDN